MSEVIKYPGYPIEKPLSERTIMDFPYAIKLRKKIKNIFVVASAYIYMASSVNPHGDYIYKPVIKNMLKNWAIFENMINKIDKKSNSIYEYVDEVLKLIRSTSLFGSEESHWISAIFGSKDCNCMCGTIFVCMCLSMSSKYKLGDSGLHVCAIPDHIYLRWGEEQGDLETTRYSDRFVDLKSNCTFTIPTNHKVSCTKVTNLIDVLILYTWNVDSTVHKMLDILDRLRIRLFDMSSKSLYMWLIVTVRNDVIGEPKLYYDLLNFLRDFFKEKPEKFIAWMDVITILLMKIGQFSKYWVVNNVMSVEDGHELLRFALDVFSPMLNIKFPVRFKNNYNSFEQSLLFMKYQKDHEFSTNNVFPSTYIYRENHIYVNGKPLTGLYSEERDDADTNHFNNYYKQFGLGV
jgi:hypothetical protein